MTAPLAKSTNHPDPIHAHIEMLHGLAKGIEGVLVVSVYYAAGGIGPITHHAVGDVDGTVEATGIRVRLAQTSIYR